MHFKFAGPKAQVCNYCQYVVARTSHGLQAQGRMADLLDIPTPLQLGVTGSWGQKPFEVAGRLQMDRAGAPGAPWQEILLRFLDDESSTWVAYAQGRWYATNEIAPSGQLPAFESLRPGGHVDLGEHGPWVVQEIAQRRIVSGEGELNDVPKPGVSTRYADISAQGGRFGTIDYGDGTGPPVLYLGRQFDPAQLTLDSGQLLEAPDAKVNVLECPNCGGDLPLLSQQSERIICKYCSTASDLTQGTLSALGPAPKPPIEPYIPIGAEGELRGQKMIVCGFVVRSCIVEGQRYDWREYLLFGGDSVGYWWLIEEDGAWQIVHPVETGDVMDSGHGCMYRGNSYSFKQQVQASVDYVIGEFYWKVEIGERVEATEFEGPGGKVSREKTDVEVTYSFVSALNPSELAAFGVAPPMGAGFGGSAMGNMAGGAFAGSAMGSAFGGDDDDISGMGSIGMTIVVLIIICVVLFAVMGDGCGGGGSYGGGSWGK